MNYKDTIYKEGVAKTKSHFVEDALIKIRKMKEECKKCHPERYAACMEAYKYSD